MSEPVPAALRPDVIAVVLGYNHPDDTIECLRSLGSSRPVRPGLLYVDNGSKPDACRCVMDAVPFARVLQLEPNVGVGRGFNAGLRDALARGAQFVLLVNNDVVAAPDMVARLLEAVEGTPRVGIVVPKIFYHAAPRRIWSAGSRYRRWPPAVVLRRTRDDDHGQLDSIRELEFATFCVALFRCELLDEVGLLDTDFHVFQEDYDLCIRARAAGWSVRYAPEAHVWHKVSLSTQTGSRNPEFWRLYGRSEALFARKHPDWPWLTGPVHRAYVALRILAERKPWGFRPFLRGYAEGIRAELHPPPRASDPPQDTPAILRAEPEPAGREMPP